MTGKTYEVIRSKFRAFIQEEGGVHIHTIKGYCNEKYHVINVDLSFADALQVYNTSKGIIYSVEDHVVYVKGDTIYDDIEERGLYEYINNFNVDCVIIPKEDIE